MAQQQRVRRFPFGFSGFGTGARAASREGSIDAQETSAGQRFWPSMVLVALCQLADLITFNFAVATFGPSGELGPLGLVYRMGGFWAVAVVKLGLIGLVLTVLARYPWQRLATRRRIALVVAAIGVVGAFTNTLAFIWLT